jgi:hypothetical protein
MLKSLLMLMLLLLQLLNGLLLLLLLLLTSLRLLLLLTVVTPGNVYYSPLDYLLLQLLLVHTEHFTETLPML